MFLIHCPHCGEARDEQEFHCAGEAFIVRPLDPETVDDATWGDYVFFRDNPKGVVWEQWSHGAGCRKFFVIKRNNVTNEILATYTMEAGKAAWLAEEGA